MTDNGSHQNDNEFEASITQEAQQTLFVKEVKE